MARFSEQDITTKLLVLPGWEREGEAITKTFGFPSFHRAVGFVMQCALLAEAADHHPDLDLRYAMVRVVLTTHSAGGLTQKDVDLAVRIEEAAR